MVVKLVLLALTVQQAWLECVNEYYHDDIKQVEATNHDWMKRVSDTKLLSELSLPGTHGTMALYERNPTITQTLRLRSQLESGIRALDIHCRHVNNGFSIYHGNVYQKATFDDVLMEVSRFLRRYPSETIVMRLANEREDSGNTRSFEDTLAAYFSDKTYLYTDSDNNPQLKDIRGKIVILQDFEGSENWGIQWGSLSIQDHSHMTTNWDLYGKWEKVKAKLGAANEDTATTNAKIHVNFLTGSGGSFPFFVASGKITSGTCDAKLATGMTTPGWESCCKDFPRENCFIGICSIYFQGTNILAGQRIGKNKEFDRKVGIVYADFPGYNLINPIISLNY